MEQTEFEQIAKSTRAKAVATALALSMSMDEAEDIAQDVMLKLWTLRNDINSKTDAEKTGRMHCTQQGNRHTPQKASATTGQPQQHSRQQGSGPGRLC